jgi:hypothetical protein
VLLRDMVVVPGQDLDLDALGLGGSLPRAVPVDSVMALVTALLPGDLVQKAVLLLAVYAAVLGAARLLPPGPDGRRGAAATVAALVYGWSPYLAERLLIGHWTLLLAYAALPWIARATLRTRAGEPRALAHLVLACAPAVLTPTGSLLAAGVVVALAGRRRVLRAAGAVLVLSLPWIVAGLLHPAGGDSDPAGVAAFAARAEGWGGPLLALLGTGGIWNAGAVPASRGSVLLPVATLLLVALAVIGWACGGALRGPGRRLALLGGLGLLLAVAGTVPGVRDVLETAVREVPGSGLLRDGQKWVAWWALALAPAAGLGARRLAATARTRGGSTAAGLVTAGAVLLPLIAVPDLAWGVGGRLQPVEYPADWQRVRDVVADDPHPGDVLVLPFGAYRASTGTTTGRSWTLPPAGCPGRRWWTTSWWSAARWSRARTCARAPWAPRPTTRGHWPNSGSAGCWSSGEPPAGPCPPRWSRCPSPWTAPTSTCSGCQRFVQCPDPRPDG